MNILNNKKLILGSQSPRRSQLLDELELPYEKRVISIDESFSEEMPYEQIAPFLAEQKAQAHKSSIQDNEVVITADSIVAINGNILGKPKDREEAINFLSILSDATHEVITGVALMSASAMISFSSVSEVKIAKISEEEMDYYLDTYKPYDKAGAYGIQEWLGHAKIEYIHGTYTNIMGLPTKEVYDQLKKFCADS